LGVSLRALRIPNARSRWRSGVTLGPVGLQCRPRRPQHPFPRPGDGCSRPNRVSLRSAVISGFAVFRARKNSRSRGIAAAPPLHPAPSGEGKRQAEGHPPAVFAPGSPGRFPDRSRSSGESALPPCHENCSPPCAWTAPPLNGPGVSPLGRAALPRLDAALVVIALGRDARPLAPLNAPLAAPRLNVATQSGAPGRLFLTFRQGSCLARHGGMSTDFVQKMQSRHGAVGHSIQFTREKEVARGRLLVQCGNRC
jgi:hypothetical protein